eukprot:2532591-Alexandrium_andersonii.AAC.2
MVLCRDTCKRQLDNLVPCKVSRWQAWPKSGVCIVAWWISQREPNNEVSSDRGNSGTFSKRTPSSLCCNRWAAHTTKASVDGLLSPSCFP